MKELIQKISDDLLASERERVADARRAVFEVADLTIELSFVATRSRQGRGGVADVLSGTRWGPDRSASAGRG